VGREGCTLPLITIHRSSGELCFATSEPFNIVSSRCWILRGAIEKRVCSSKGVSWLLLRASSNRPKRERKAEREGERGRNAKWHPKEFGRIDVGNLARESSRPIARHSSSNWPRNSVPDDLSALGLTAQKKRSLSR